MKILLSVIFLFSGQVFADSKSDICSEFLKSEKELNKSLPKQVDEYTVLVQLSVNCDTEVIKYTKKVNALGSDFMGGWKGRKQRQHTQLHCNDNGLASKTKWTAQDVIFDKNNDYLITLTTSPNDCN